MDIYICTFIFATLKEISVPLFFSFQRGADYDNPLFWFHY